MDVFFGGKRDCVGRLEDADVPSVCVGGRVVRSKEMEIWRYGINESKD